MIKIISPFLISFTFLFSYKGYADENQMLTLYRNSVIDTHMRIHVASFNAKDGYDYNSENCHLAAELFQNQLGVVTRFWCEIGNFKK